MTLQAIIQKKAGVFASSARRLNRLIWNKDKKVEEELNAKWHLRWEYF